MNLPSTAIAQICQRNSLKEMFYWMYSILAEFKSAPNRYLLGPPPALASQPWELNHVPAFKSDSLSSSALPRRPLPFAQEDRCHTRRQSRDRTESGLTCLQHSKHALRTHALFVIKNKGTRGKQEATCWWNRNACWAKNGITWAIYYYI